MSHQNFRHHSVIDIGIRTISIKCFHLQFSFHRKSRRLFLISLILTSSITFWYVLYHTPPHLSLSFNNELLRNVKSVENSTLQNTRNVYGKDKQRMVMNEKYFILYGIQSFIRQILIFVQEILSSLKWHFFLKLNLQKIPLVMLNYTTDNIRDETLFIYKAFLDLRQKEPLIRILAFSQCRDINTIIHYHSQCIPANDITIEYDCPWKWVPECKWFSFMLVFNMKDTNFSTNTVSVICNYKHCVINNYKYRVINNYKYRKCH